MKLGNKLSGIFTPVVMGVLLVSVLYILLLSSNLTGIIDTLSEASNRLELSHLKAIAAQQSGVLNANFAQSQCKVELFGKLSGAILSTNGALKAGHKPPPWSGVTQIQPNTPPKFTYYSEVARSESFNASCWFLPDASSLINVTVKDWQLINNTSVIDFVARPLVRADSIELDTRVYIGFNESCLFIMYPYRRLDSFLTSKYTCYAYNPPIKQTGYSPCCRKWFTKAKDTMSLVVPDPFVGASTGELMMSPSVPIFVNGKFDGVAALGYSVADLYSLISGTRILTSGYCYVLSRSADVIIHPKQSKSRVQSFFDIEFHNSENEWDDFHAHILPLITSGQSGIAKYQKSSVTWVMAFQALTSINYTVVVTVPESDIIAPSLTITESMQSVILTTSLISASLMVLVVFWVEYVSRRLQSTVVGPLEKLVSSCKLVMKRRSLDLGNLNWSQLDVGVSPEVDNLYGLSIALLVAVRFGDRDYLAGQYKSALKHYSRCLEVFQKLENKAAIGICLHNMGSAALGLENFSKASNYFSASIDNAKVQIAGKASTNNMSHESSINMEEIGPQDLRITYASRLMHLAQCKILEFVQFPHLKELLPQSFDLLVSALQISLECRQPIVTIDIIVSMSEVLHLQQKKDKASELLMIASEIVGIDTKYIIDSSNGKGITLTNPQNGDFKILSDITAIDMTFLSKQPAVSSLYENEEQRMTNIHRVGLGWAKYYNMAKNHYLAARWCEKVLETGERIDRDIMGNAIAMLSSQMDELKWKIPENSVLAQYTTAPLKDLSILVDFSGSMHGDRADSAIRNVGMLLDDHVEMFKYCSLHIFGDTCREIMPLTNVESLGSSDRVMGQQTLLGWTSDKVMERLKQQEFLGWTALYDSILKCLPTTEGSWLVVLTDGGDNAGSTSLLKCHDYIAENKKTVSASEKGKVIKVKAGQALSCLDDAFGEAIRVIKQSVGIESFA